MTIPVIQTAVNAGEMSPALFGRVDLDKHKHGCSTQRNFFASYRGGAQSRAGTKFVGQCKQGNRGTAGSVSPPQLIPFQYSVGQGIVLELGELYMRFAINGAYVTEAPVAITGISRANPGVVSVVNTWTTGDEIYFAGIVGMTELNNQSFIVGARTGGTVQLISTLTNQPIDTSAFAAYVSGGTAARIYTLTTPYAAVDLPSLKWAQSADVMTLVHPSYPPYDLARIANNSWTLTKTSFSAGSVAPASCSVSTTGAGSFTYQYCATSISATTGEESVASPIGTTASVNIATQAGTLTVTCDSVTGSSSYNFYRAPETYVSSPVAGQLFGFVGRSDGPAFTDSNITPDYTVTPPLHLNPFATTSVIAVQMTNVGASYSQTATTVAITTATGAGFVGIPVVINGAIQWVITQNGGENYRVADTVAFTDGTGAGHSASATLNIGASTGTYPACVAYFQQRRFYADSVNDPDTYWATQPGAFKNMDASNPVQADDAITGSPWSQQVNGIQWMINMPGGLVILTGLGAWQLSGGGGGLASAAAITPSDQVAVPQAYNGVSPTVRPITINYDILYVQEKGSIVRDLSYNFFVNIYTGTDMTVLSNHLFDGHTILRWDWAEEPYKLVWAVRDDGVLLCLTYLKEQDVYAWSRHDTNGLFQSVCCVSEPPVNAPYFVVKRLIQSTGTPVYAYYLERMDNRIWQNVDDTWAVDCGLSYPLNAPVATLSVSSATGTSTLQQPTVVYGGANYGPATTARVVDASPGTGNGATAAVTIVGGVITAASVGGTLTGYTNPQFVIFDPSLAGGGAVVELTSARVATATASAAVFSNTAGLGAAGDILHIGAGMMEVLSYDSATSLTVDITRPITQVFPNDPLRTPVPAASGDWTIINPTDTVSGLDHLEGMLVSVLADGVALTPMTVGNGAITLPVPASSIVVGLGYTCQLQTMYFDVPAPVTVQGRRKTVFNVCARVDRSSGPFELGANQPDASVQPGFADVPWDHLTMVNQPFSNQSPLQPFDLYTGDVYQNVEDSLGNDRGQVCVQQSRPLPLNVLALISWVELQDDAG